jgi:enoyl-CoA hydratase/carnithine racemase
VGLAAAADLVIASDGAVFALTELLFGAVPAIVAPALLRRMSEARLVLWALSSQTWSATEAAAAGLVDLCVPAQELEQATGKWVRRLQRADPGAVVAFKRHVSRAASLTAGDGVRATLERFRDPDVLRRVKAFVEDGDAPWLNAD